MRDYRQGDFEELYRIDTECFQPEIAYSRSELQSFIQRKNSFCIIAEHAATEHKPEAGLSGTPVFHPNKPGAGLSGTPAPTPGGEAGQREATPVAAEAAAGKRKEGIAGFVVVEMHREGYGHVITLDVRREFRRHQLGMSLMQAAEERTRKLGGFMMVLETAVNNVAALAFYERRSYKILKRLPRYYTSNLDALFLTKRL